MSALVTPISISIVGGGLSGSALALLLGKYGYKNIHVFEKRPRENDPQQRARSINLALSERGIKTLEKTGIIHEIQDIAIPMNGRMIHSVDGKQTFQPYSSDANRCLYSVSRQLLNDKLKGHADELGNVKFHYNSNISELNLRSKTFTSTDTKLNNTSKYSFNTLIGCDGAFSQVRSNMVKFDRQEYSQSYLKHGYKELSIPANEDGSFKLDKNSLHIWPRNSYMMIALPNIDGSFTCTLFFPFDSIEEGGDCFSKLNSKDQVEEFFKRVFPDAYGMMPTLLEDYFQNPTSSLVTIKTEPWYYKDTSVLVGDAAHAIVPFYGQGMNAAFEDCLEFYNTMINTFPDASLESFSAEKLENAYKSYQNARKANSDAIAEMAVENFFEMRDLVADPLFVFQKKVEHLLETKFPGRYISRYELISFSTTPYSEAQNTGRINRNILSKLVENNTDYDLSKIDLTLADRLIKVLLNK